MPNKFYTALTALLAGAPVADAIQALYQTAIAENLPVAVWRLPHSDIITLCLSFSPAQHEWEPQLEHEKPGFAFCPFQESLAACNLFIPADLVYTTAAGLVSKPNVEGINKHFLSDFLKRVEKTLGNTTSPGWHVSQQDCPQTVNQKSYTDLVEKGIEAIKAGELEKIVPSRCKKVSLPVNFNLTTLFLNLTRKYDHAFVSLGSVPQVGTWLGATPEILVTIDQNQIFKTMALAGTQALAAAPSPTQAVWRQKEIEEQALVTRYIISCFKKLRLREYEEVGPRTVVAGNLMHLRSDFKVDMAQTGFPELGTQMLQLLHPTSAVCGMPHEHALDFLRKNEKYNRSYYSGYLG
ncbi:MAG: chorismate-binding protein, partial [Hymenobacteraceae bacterium]|nr:chorismate-binding protein [Hymenobacteraceae bacterium]MDX5396803.1 chorismate-binding protein [Hymenobacteraceae bacterium]MDX5512871.1 chorismate-binding protein [Hymenobacteraceae bacterium]